MIINLHSNIYPKASAALYARNPSFCPTNLRIFFRLQPFLRPVFFPHVFFVLTMMFFCATHRSSEPKSTKYRQRERKVSPKMTTFADAKRDIDTATAPDAKRNNMTQQWNDL